MATQLMVIDLEKEFREHAMRRAELEALDLLVEVYELPKDENELNQLIANNKQKIRLGCKSFGRVTDLAKFIGRKEDWVTIAKSILRRVEWGDTMKEAIEGAIGIVLLEQDYINNDIIVYNCPECKRVRAIEITENTQFIGHSKDFCKSHTV